MHGDRVLAQPLCDVGVGLAVRIQCGAEDQPLGSIRLRNRTHHDDRTVRAVQAVSADTPAEQPDQAEMSGRSDNQQIRGVRLMDEHPARAPLDRDALNHDATADDRAHLGNCELGAGPRPGLPRGQFGQTPRRDGARIPGGHDMEPEAPRPGLGRGPADRDPRRCRAVVPHGDVGWTGPSSGVIGGSCCVTAQSDLASGVRGQAGSKVPSATAGGQACRTAAPS